MAVVQFGSRQISFIALGLVHTALGAIGAATKNENSKEKLTGRSIIVLVAGLTADDSELILALGPFSYTFQVLRYPGA
jgi:hypothetical protein